MKEFKGDRGGLWRYDEEDLLGPPGGFGAVFAGESAAGALVAVKVIHKVGAFGQELPTMLHRREADIAETLRDVQTEHLIRVLDLAHVDDDLLLVLERADASLAEMVGATVGQEETVDILLDVVRGLEELHKAGIIHRDLKPGNILRHEGKWKLTDFGIARDSTIGTGYPTFVGAGTPPYMAPEAFIGSPSVLTDLYAVGCLAYQLISGKLPIDTPSDGDWAKAHGTEVVPALREGVNPSLRSLVVRLLAKDPALRPQDARDVRERLERLALPLSPMQEVVQQLNTVHDEEKSLLRAEEAAAEARLKAFSDTQVRARADLADICQEAHALLQQASPDVQFQVTEGGFVFMYEGDHGSLNIVLWRIALPPWETDTPRDAFAHAGEVLGENKRPSGLFRLANVVYEEEEGRYSWFLYRFTAGPVRDYHPGPVDRPHGFEENYFIQDRTYMRVSAMHIWNLERRVLVADDLVALFAVVLELPRSRS